MRILHYFLGFPPYRSGGLTKFAVDLLESQKQMGHVVIALWPGKMNFLSSKVFVKKHTNYRNILNYELINPLPVPLDEGILDICAYTKTCDKAVFENFFKNVRPDVIHIHTLMGLYGEFIDAAEKLKIRTVFTSHDYFGLCPKVTMFRNGTVCLDYGCSKCASCNASALSINTIKILQSPIYRCLKNFPLVKTLRKEHRSSFFQEKETDVEHECQDASFDEDYRRLRTFYINILSRIDYIHFNSSLTESVYNHFFKPKNSRVLSITHKNITDCRGEMKKEPSKKLRLTYLAPARPAKGYVVMKKALDELWHENFCSFELKLFCPVSNPSPYMNVSEDAFSYERLKKIFENTDVLLAPSVWFETFGFTVLEALSFGTPVIVTDNVGAKDIVGRGGIVIEAGSVDALKNAIKSLTSQKIRQLNSELKESCNIKTWPIFLQEMELLYKNLLSGVRI